MNRVKYIVLLVAAMACVSIVSGRELRLSAYIDTIPETITEPFLTLPDSSYSSNVSAVDSSVSALLYSMEADTIDLAEVRIASMIDSIVGDSTLLLRLFNVVMADSLSDTTLTIENLRSQLVDMKTGGEPDSTMLGRIELVTSGKDIVESSVDTKSRQAIDAPIDYNATDSMAISLDSLGQMAYLYGNAKIVYKDIELEAGFISINFKNKEIYAEGLTDSSGVVSQKPHFKEGTEEFDCENLRYNFETSRGFVHNVITEQEDGVVHGAKAKMLSKDVYCITDGKYSTCDAEHPHFYLHLTKGKMINKKAMITGRAYMVLEDFPIYVPFLPYGYIPTGKKTYSSGILIPSYGEEDTYGFFLKDGGFYWAASEYFDFKIAGDIYTMGSWALNFATQYRLKYKFNGNFGLSISRHYTGTKGIDQQVSKNFRLNWTHNQDAKANPAQTLSASVSFSTSGYNKLNEFTDYDEVMKNTKTSNVTYTRSLFDSKLKLHVKMSASQNTSDSTLSLNLPTISLTLPKAIEPFKRKNSNGPKRFYENLSFTYSSNFMNTVSMKESELLTTPLSEWKNGIKHNIGINLPSFTLLKHINVSPSVSYGETWHFNYIDRYWVDGYNLYDADGVEQWVPGHVEEAKIDRFRRTYSYSYGASASTTLYGFFQMKNPNSRIKGIRHKIDPSVSLSISPDFQKERFGFSDWVQTDSIGTMTQYSHFAKSAYPYTAGSKSGTVSFGLKNNLEMKVANPKDTSSANATKKIVLIENLSLNASYNLAADSMNLSTISGGFSTKVAGQPISIRFVIDPYALNEQGKKINKYRWNETTGLGRIGRLTSASTGFSFSLTPDKLKNIMGKWSSKGGAVSEGTQSSHSADLPSIGMDDKLTDEFDMNNSDDPAGMNVGHGGDNMSTNKEPGNGDAHSPRDERNKEYQPFKMPWSLSLNYSLSYSKAAFKPTITQSLRFSGNIEVTSKWKVGAQSGFDFKTKKINSLNLTASRSLHCWNMSFNVSPLGISKYYSFTLNCNASMLQDLKIERQNR